MIRKFYMPDDPPGADPATTATVAGGGDPAAAGGGGGGTAAPPAAPKGYTVSTPQQRTDWNGFLDYASKQGTDLTNAKNQTAALAAYKKANPNFSITADQIPNIQYEAYQIRKGNSFGNLDQKALGYLRQGLQPNFLNADTTNVSKLYYPQEAGFGTDLENYYNNKFNPAAATAPGGPAAPSAKVTSVAAPAAPTITGTPSAAASPSTLTGTYADHDQALKRVTALASQPGNAWMHGRGDALINANYVPGSDNLSFRDSSLKAAKAQGLDPNMLWASAAEEGATGLVPDKKGNVNTDKDIDVNSKYGVSGFANFGVDHFHGDFKELVSKGYLPKDFDYKPSAHVNERGEKVMSGDFKTVEDALAAKAAYIHLHQDKLDDWQKDNGVSLSPAARQFFTYISYNGGPGTAHKLINYYKSQGLLAGDKFLNQAPPKDLDQSDSYGKVLPRWKMAQVMQQEKLFQDSN